MQAYNQISYEKLPKTTFSGHLHPKIDKLPYCIGKNITKKQNNTSSIIPKFIMPLKI
jgi:hypothetical protein